MEEHFKLSDEEFLMQLSNCTLSSDWFTHKAHLRLAWILIDTYGPKDAPVELEGRLKAYIHSLGEDCKYNQTVTIASAKIISRLLQQSSTSNFIDFLEENGELVSNFKELLLKHYRADIFRSELAKKEFISPDVPFE